MAPVVSISGLSKTYKSGFTALKDISLDIREGEIFGLLGPNGAGKTTLISIVCGIVTKSSGSVSVGGFDIERDYRKTRSLIGLVPQELTVETFEKVIDTVRLSRGLFGKPRDDAHIEKVLKSLSLWDKKDAVVRTLSGGMKRRLLIAKALSHEPAVLFLDEPTAGVDVALRKEMWATVRDLRAQGTTVILTTHYIDEAEEMADRIGVINKGEMILTEEKHALMKTLGQKRLTLKLASPLAAVPGALASFGLEMAESGTVLHYTYGEAGEESEIGTLLAAVAKAKLPIADIATSERSLEDIFVNLVQS